LRIIYFTTNLLREVLYVRFYQINDIPSGPEFLSFQTGELH
jgi:hypothetical protein